MSKGAPKPDALEVQSAFFKKLMPLIGQLNYSWTNTESLLIHLIGGLIGTDNETAILVFLTLNTTRARIDLVERLAKRDITNKDERVSILSATKKFSNQARLKNKYNHCIYSFDPEQGGVRTIHMRIFDKKETMNYGKLEDVDERELARIESAIAEIENINQEFWRIIRKFNYEH